MNVHHVPLRQNVEEIRLGQYTAHTTRVVNCFLSLFVSLTPLSSTLLPPSKTIFYSFSKKQNMV